MGWEVANSKCESDSDDLVILNVELMKLRNECRDHDTTCELDRSVLSIPWPATRLDDISKRRAARGCLHSRLGLMFGLGLLV